MPDERQPDDDPLVRYWDELVRGHPEPSSDLNLAVTDAIRRVHALDDTPAPDRLFVNTLWEDLMHTPPHASSLVPAGHAPPNGTATSGPRAVEWPGRSTTGSQRHWRALATAALIVLVLGGTFVAFGWPRREPGDGAATIPAAGSTSAISIATPVQKPPRLGAAIDPVECRVAPRTVDEILALWYPERVAGTPVRTELTRETRTSLPVPLGEPADALTVEGIGLTMRETAACVNAGDNLRVLALLSDDFVGSLGAGSETPYEDERATLEMPTVPRPVAERLRLLAITDISVMADGRVGAFLVYDDPQLSPPTVRTMFATLVEERGRWVFDEFVEFWGDPDE